MCHKPSHFVAFPYAVLDSTAELVIEEVPLKAACERNLAAEDKQTRDALMTARKCFSQHRVQQAPVQYWTYSLLTVTDGLKSKDQLDRLNRIANILRFVYLSGEPNGTEFENFNYWIFPLDAGLVVDSEYIYVEGLLNGLVPCGFDIKNGVASNPFLPPEYLSPQPIRVQELEENQFFSSLCRNHNSLFFEPEARQKVIRAIEWFNRSFSHTGRGVDASEAILNMHTALEALLKPLQDDKGSVKAEVRTGLMTLLGQRRAVSDWFDSFFSLRNSLVHGDVNPKSFLYVHKLSQSKVGNWPHLALAREVFLECLRLILHSAQERPLHGFEEKLRPNEDRINEAIKSLKQAKRGKVGWAEIARGPLLTPIRGLRTDDLTSPKGKAIELGGLLLPHVRDELTSATEGEPTPLAIELIDRILVLKESPPRTIAPVYSQLERAFQQFYFSQKQTPDSRSLRAAARGFISYASWRLLTFRD